ncbi:MAG: N-6 DNA methylase [Gammaproteobacteria bacterium]|nr:N-6 DNA methylase [Gammaproteobacteria bacterium]MYD81568.1 N-6 DNA methylase [Gammaproteobacteria bacterium]
MATEVDAYIFIKRKLNELGWDTRNPQRNPDGQVYTQNECLANPYIKAALGRERPENIVKITEGEIWVIEAKSTHGNIDKASNEAKEYASKINSRSIYSTRIVSGVAGNDDDGFVVKTKYLKNQKWLPVEINGIEATGLLSPNECDTLLSTNQSNIEDPEIDDRRFIATAEKINSILHEGAVNPHQRATVVSALLLSMLTQHGPNIEERETSILIDDINARVRNVLRAQGKSGFREQINIPLPSAAENHVKFRRALVESLQELRGLNIHSAMQSGADWLGTFYEVFLKYARWSRDLGIVLTPRHITQFAARVMNITSRDIVYDPTCGTGGFLVSAFEVVKKNATKSQLEKFKQNSVFGLEQDDGIAALAIVNMIFRGDGKNNIEQANCFAKSLTRK